MPNDNIAQEAIDYVLDKPVSPSFSYLDIWREEHSKAFTIAKLMNQDLLDFMQLEIAKSIEEGTAYEAFRALAEKRLMEAGWWGKAIMQDPLTGESKEVQLGSNSRLKLIYETNARTSYARQTWKEYDSSDAITHLEYVIGPSKDHREEHVAWDGLVLPKESNFWKYAMPPNGYGCKCSVIGVSRYEIESGEVEVGKEPKLKRMAYVNKRTGKVEMGYGGIQPGFAYNAGAVSSAEIKKKMLNHFVSILCA